MVMRKNDFVWVKQFLIFDTEGEMNCWVDEEDLEDFKETFSDCFEDGSMKTTEERSLRGKDWNKFLIENTTYGDHEGDFINEDCPMCGHFLIRPHVFYNEKDELFRHCSDCDYQNDLLLEAIKKREEEYEGLRNKPPSPKFREPDLTVEEFAEKYKLRFNDKKDTTFEKCVMCKKPFILDEYFVQGGYAMITFKHEKDEGCANKGGTMATPISKKEKDFWRTII
jgi:DNA-directed RNA polymerase subunit M/transcription elongation factor TFIIS